MWSWSFACRSDLSWIADDTWPKVLAKEDADWQQDNQEYLTSCASLELYRRHTHTHTHVNYALHTHNHSHRLHICTHRVVAQAHLNMHICAWTHTYTHAVSCQAFPVSWCDAICFSAGRSKSVQFSGLQAHKKLQTHAGNAHVLSQQQGGTNECIHRHTHTHSLKPLFWATGMFYNCKTLLN